MDRVIGVRPVLSAKLESSAKEALSLWGVLVGKGPDSFSPRLKGHHVESSSEFLRLRKGGLRVPSSSPHEPSLGQGLKGSSVSRFLDRFKGREANELLEQQSLSAADHLIFNGRPLVTLVILSDESNRFLTVGFQIRSLNVWSKPTFTDGVRHYGLSLTFGSPQGFEFASILSDTPQSLGDRHHTLKVDLQPFRDRSTGRSSRSDLFSLTVWRHGAIKGGFVKRQFSHSLVTGGRSRTQILEVLPQGFVSRHWFALRAR